MSNPLLKSTDLPLFSEILPEHIEPAIDELLANNRRHIQNLLNANTQYTWDNLIQPIEEMEEWLERTWSPVSHMNSVVNNEALRHAYNACLPKLSAYGTEMGQNETLFNAYQHIANSREYAALDTAQQKIIDNELRDFKLSGVNLPTEQKARYKDLVETLSHLNSKFGENVLDATQAWRKHMTDENLLQGLPDSVKQMAKATAAAQDLAGWLINLEFPLYYPTMCYADNRSLREELYYAYVTRASDQDANKKQWDNSDIIEQILTARHEVAQLLGFDNYAKRSLATKMATDTQQVITFLEDLATKSLPMATAELEELTTFAKTQHNQITLEAWDIPYYSEKLREHKYAISQETVKQYFPINQVLKGLFHVVSQLYGITIEESEGINAWHDEVRFFTITDAANDKRGQFYLDLYARQNKRGGAWMDECRTRLKRANGEQQLPVAYLVCNFSPPTAQLPSLLTHNEVTTLFHEFGHGIHHMLTQINYPSVAGISGVAWDAVELPSQFMENWCWERETLDLISAHHETGAAIPDELYQKMMAAKNFQAGMQMVRQLELALFDFRLHLEYDSQQGGRVAEILQKVRDKVAVIQPPAFNRFQHAFSHIFAGGYAAGYYSYKWAEVLSADAFSKFEENGIFDSETGRSFMENILELGGSKDPMALFIAFRGREPSIDALLRHSGITG